MATKTTARNGAPSKSSPYAVISMGGYIGYMLLFAIPMVGWVICIIMAFVSTNKNLCNFARATLVFLLIGLVLSITMFFLSKWAWGIMGGYMQQIIPFFQ
jgi:hypothetical protein